MGKILDKARARWSKLTDTQKAAAVGGGLFLFAGLVASRKKPPMAGGGIRGRLVCPAEVGGGAVPTTRAEPLDYVTLVLARVGDDKKREVVWGQIMSISPDNREFYVELVERVTGGSGDLSSVAVVPIPGVGVAPDVSDLERDDGHRGPNPKLHGYRAGQHLFVERSCVWEMMKMPDASREGLGQVVCGPAALSKVSGVPAINVELRKGQAAYIVLTNTEGTGSLTRATVAIEGVSITNMIVFVEIISFEADGDLYGFTIGDHLELTRDCVFDVSN